MGWSRFCAAMDQPNLGLFMKVNGSPLDDSEWTFTCVDGSQDCESKHCLHATSTEQLMLGSTYLDTHIDTFCRHL